MAAAAQLWSDKADAQVTCFCSCRSKAPCLLRTPASDLLNSSGPRPDARPGLPQLTTTNLALGAMRRIFVHVPAGLLPGDLWLQIHKRSLLVLIAPASPRSTRSSTPAWRSDCWCHLHCRFEELVALVCPAHRRACVPDFIRNSQLLGNLVEQLLVAELVSSPRKRPSPPRTSRDHSSWAPSSSSAGACPSPDRTSVSRSCEPPKHRTCRAEHLRWRLAVTAPRSSSPVIGVVAPRHLRDPCAVCLTGPRSP